MFVRALQAVQVNSLRGLIYLKGPDSIENEEGGSTQVAPGDVCQVADDFVVNPEALEVVVPVPDTVPQQYQRAKVQPPAPGAKGTKDKEPAGKPGKDKEPAGTGA